MRKETLTYRIRSKTISLQRWYTRCFNDYRRP